MLRFALLPIALASVGGCSDGCGNTLVRSVPAPDGLHVATMFERNCGATTDFTTQVSVLRAGEHPSDRGNAFIADSDDDAARRGKWGGPWAETVWIDNGHLLIRHAPKSRIFAQHERVSGVTIRYREQ